MEEVESATLKHPQQQLTTHLRLHLKAKDLRLTNQAQPFIFSLEPHKGCTHLLLRSPALFMLLIRESKLSFQNLHLFQHLTLQQSYSDHQELRWKAPFHLFLVQEQIQVLVFTPQVVHNHQRNLHQQLLISLQVGKQAKSCFQHLFLHLIPLQFCSNLLE